MIKISKNHLSLCSFTTIIFFFVHNANANMSFSKRDHFSCSDSEPFYRCNDGKAHEISQKTYKLTGESHGAAVEASGEDTVIEADSIIINGVSYAKDHSGKSSWTTGVKASTEGSVALFKSILNNVSIGADVDDGGAFEMRDGVINAIRMGISVAGEQSFIFLSNTEIKTSTGAISLFSQGNAKIEMKAGKIDFTNGIGVQTAGGGKVILDGVSITGGEKQATNTGSHSENSAFQMLQGDGSITFQKGRVNITNAHGLSFQGNDNNAAHIKNSTIMVRNQTFNGMRFFWEAAFNGGEKTVLSGRGAVHLTKASFMVPESTAIYSRQFKSSIELSQGSTVFGDLLLRAEENSIVKIRADASTLIGGTHVDKNSTAALQLKNNSKWTLLRPRYEKLQDSASSGPQLGEYSSISSLDLSDSSLFFKELKTGDTYNTLLVGKGSGKVYHAQGNAHLYLNTYLDKGGALQDQKTDRLLVHGDVSGTTTVHVRDALGSRGEYTGERGNSKGISIIQVYGTANEDSFQLNGGYVTSQGSPYRYSLYAYGPSSSLGGANSSQRVLKGEGEFWDFRLESEEIQPTSSDTTDLFLIRYLPVSGHTLPENTPSSFSDLLPDIVGDESTFVEVGESAEDSKLSSLLPTVPSFSIVTLVGATANEPKVLSHSSASRSISTASSATFSPYVRPVDTDTVKKHPSALTTVPNDKSTLASVLVTPEEGAAGSERDRVSAIAKVVLASELSSHFQQNVRAVVPQVSTYLLLPNSLFHAGLMDISNQNKWLETLRNVSRRSLKDDENFALFLRGYGSNHRYVSNLSVLEYGYGGELDYNAIEAGTLLKNIESAYSTTSFGVMGTYGKVSLQPLNVEQSRESTFDKWTVTAYGSMQHDAGFYMDGLLSYGLFNGDVLTLARGKTVTLRGKPLSVSLTTGKAFMMKCKNFVLEPQIQFVYQYLRFNTAHDVDNFNIEMKKPDYWVMRIGGRLTKALAVIREAHVVSFYGKLHFVRDFSDKQRVHLGDSFLLGAYGSSLEAGFGVYAQLSPKVTFHSDLIYQHKLTKAGFSGTHFSGGLSYHF
ncbi:autotransporter outer membrane beta-barrel domain-containing protein [Bartonella taylorii]|uniref:Autotransporter outer membrane beta-barrel domain-containing protein n=1 Tax=Bartonella taylorii TaxID=33046 RepID=A0A9Q8YZ18_BARTA|nr:autotransporter outer membrane beta-barrel domain-containing protein [Bartonella taylorii]OPB34893.1 outer membrane autotransporter barrel domain-containing protein [Bartonella taylorii]USP03527.1 autotransporter outer membrane beta-barrel domain-containing protein [Bartonella taylorii]